MDYYQCLRTFCDVTELGSFSKTAKKRYLSPSAVSKQIDWLETRMKITLMIRSTRQLTITPEGQELYQLTKKFLRDFNLLQQCLSNKRNEIVGNLRITAPPTFGEHIMAEWIHEFISEHTKIHIDFILDNRFLDLITNEIDLAIRTKETTDTNYLCEKIFDLRYGVFATPSYLKKNGTPKKPADLIKHSCLLHREVNEPAWTFKNNQKIYVSGNYVCNSNFAIMEAAKSGLGLINRFRHNQIQKLLDTGDLVEVLADYAAPALPIYLCYLNQTTIPKRTSALCDLLRKKFKALQ